VRTRAQESDRRLLLEHGYVLSLDSQDTRGRLSIAVVDGRIDAIGGRAALRTQHPRARRIDCRGRVIMPGLVNAHLHPDLHVLKGELEELGLHDWQGAHRFNAAVDFLGTTAGAPVQRAAVRASLAEAALSGTTCVGTYGVSADSERACEDALGELGLRGSITIRDVAFAPRDAPPTTITAPSALRPLYRLHAEEALFQDELDAAAAAHARGERIVMHAAETRDRIDIVKRRFGTTTLRLLDRNRLLSPATLLSHAVHVDTAEIEIMARHGVNVVVSPAAEMKLADGTPPVQDMQKRGINVALGTDAAVCNNATDMFLEMRLFGLSQKVRYGARAAPAEQILLMATRSGAAALGASNDIGCLAEGMAADLIMVETDNPRMQPLLLERTPSNLAANLVYAATGTDVTDVMVAGRWIVRRRRLLTLDQRTLWRDLRQAARQLHTHMRHAT
jgi:5-methylthioadenosine/S-adenosylhomocysteine deaminase